MTTFVIAGIGGMSPEFNQIYDKYETNMTSISNQTSALHTTITNTAQSITFDPSPLNILASALGGITSTVITLGSLLLTTLLAIPILLVNLVFGITLDSVSYVAPAYSPMVILLRDLFIVIVPVIIVIGLLVKFILGKPTDIF